MRKQDITGGSKKGGILSSLALELVLQLDLADVSLLHL